MPPPTINSIRKLAYRVRKAFERENVPHYYDDNLAGACGVLTGILTEILKKRGIIAIPIWGDFAMEEFKGYGCHAWTYLPEYDKILDITCTQFGKYPKVLFKRKPPIYQKGQVKSTQWIASYEMEVVNKMVDKFWRIR